MTGTISYPASSSSNIIGRQKYTFGTVCRSDSNNAGSRCCFIVGGGGRRVRARKMSPTATVQYKANIVTATKIVLLLNLSLAISIFYTIWSPSTQPLIPTINAQLSEPPSPPQHHHYPSDSTYDTVGGGADESDFNEFAEFEVDTDHINTPLDQQTNRVNRPKQPQGTAGSPTKRNAASQQTIKSDDNNDKKHNTDENEPATTPVIGGAKQDKNRPFKPTADNEQPAKQFSNSQGDAEDIDEEDDDFEYKADESRPKEDLKVINAPMPIKYTWDTYYVEIMFMMIIALYFVNFFIGSVKNEQFACMWYEANRALLRQNFALVGGPPQLPQPAGDKEDSGDSQKPKQQRGLIKDTESSYVLWCSGRVGMEGLLVEINLLKRQDLLSMFMNLLKPSKDNFILRMPLNQDSIDNFVFCLAQKSTSARLAKEMVDINTFCPERKPVSRYGVNSEKLYLMNEIKEVSTFLFDTKTSQLISKYEDCIDFIHITDQYSLARQQEDMQAAQKLANVRRMATFSFHFPKHSQESLKNEASAVNGINDDGRQNTKTLVILALTIVDRLRRFRLGREGKQKSEKNRQKITDILQKAVFAQRQEAAQAKKEELRRKEKERIYEEDDPEKQRKWDKKEAKRELKKSRKVKQLKVKSKG